MQVPGTQRLAEAELQLEAAEQARAAQEALLQDRLAEARAERDALSAEAAAAAEMAQLLKEQRARLAELEAAAAAASSARPSTPEATAATDAEQLRRELEHLHTRLQVGCCDVVAEMLGLSAATFMPVPGVGMRRLSCQTHAMLVPARQPVLQTHPPACHKCSLTCALCPCPVPPQSLEPLAGEVEVLRCEVAASEETLTDCLTSLGQEEAKVGGWRLPPCQKGEAVWQVLGRFLLRFWSIPSCQCLPLSRSSCLRPKPLTDHALMCATTIANRWPASWTCWLLGGKTPLHWRLCWPR